MYVYPVVAGTKLPAVFTQVRDRNRRRTRWTRREIGAHRNAWIDEWTQIVLQ